MPEEKKETTQSFSKEDIEKNKGMAIVAYFLFFVPLLTDAKDSKFAKYHVKQSLMILLSWIAVSVVGSILPIIGWFIIAPVGGILVFVLWVMGLMNAINGKAKPVPIVGNWANQLFKF